MESEYYERYARWERTHWWFVARRRILDAVLRRHLPQAPVQILEVGCGTGGSCELLAQYGDVTAVDIGEEVIEFVRNERYRGFVMTSLESLGIRSASFDLVVALDVVEHIDDERSAVREIHRVCKPAGLALITVPAFRSLWGQQDVISHHQRRYTAGELRRLLEGAGFSIATLTYFNTLLFPIVAAIRIGRRLLKSGANRSVESDFAMLPLRPVSAVSQAIFSLEAAVLPTITLPFGVSILCVARKT